MSDAAAMTYREACKQAIRDALLADPKCFLRDGPRGPPWDDPWHGTRTASGNDPG